MLQVTCLTLLTEKWLPQPQNFYQRTQVYGHLLPPPEVTYNFILEDLETLVLNTRPNTCVLFVDDQSLKLLHPLASTLENKPHA